MDPDLKGVSHVIVDEIHERGMNEGIYTYKALCLLAIIFKYSELAYT
jgi:hypothetical protein